MTSNTSHKHDRALSAIINPHNQEPAFDLDFAINCWTTCQDAPNNANRTPEM